LDGYFDFYSRRRPHQALQYRTPAELYLKQKGKEEQLCLVGVRPKSVNLRRNRSRITLAPSWNAFGCVFNFQPNPLPPRLSKMEGSYAKGHRTDYM
jgi:hypothetical protein